MTSGKATDFALRIVSYVLPYLISYKLDDPWVKI